MLYFNSNIPLSIYAHVPQNLKRVNTYEQIKLNCELIIQSFIKSKQKGVKYSMYCVCL